MHVQPYGLYVSTCIDLHINNQLGWYINIPIQKPIYIFDFVLRNILGKYYISLSSGQYEDYKKMRHY